MKLSIMLVAVFAGIIHIQCGSVGSPTDVGQDELSPRDVELQLIPIIDSLSARINSLSDAEMDRLISTQDRLDSVRQYLDRSTGPLTYFGHPWIHATPANGEYPGGTTLTLRLRNYDFYDPSVMLYSHNNGQAGITKVIDGITYHLDYYPGSPTMKLDRSDEIIVPGNYAYYGDVLQVPAGTGGFTVEYDAGDLLVFHQGMLIRYYSDHNGTVVLDSSVYYYAGDSVILPSPVTINYWEGDYLTVTRDALYTGWGAIWRYRVQAVFMPSSAMTPASQEMFFEYDTR